MAEPLADPRTMRALAHPTRLALLEALNLHPSLTATEASELIGVSPTNCAFHLRTLAKYGFVEEVETGSPGRRRPWRIRSADVTFSDVQDDAESALAARALSDVMLEHWLGRIRAVQAGRHEWPVAWQQVLGGSQTIAYVTAEETQAMLDDIRAVLGRHQERARDPERRPEGAAAVEMLLFAQLFPTRPDGAAPAA
jgi:DNA-binding transcriptional ArsR family regulator